MQLYRNLSNDSGVHSFEIGHDFIRVKFPGQLEYIHTATPSAGEIHIEQMKSLALSGKGLNSYINKHTKYYMIDYIPYS